MSHLRLSLTQRMELHRTPALAAVNEVLQVMGPVAVSPGARCYLRDDVDILCLLVRHYCASKLQSEMTLDFAGSLFELNDEQFYLCTAFHTGFAPEGGTIIILEEEHDRCATPLVDWPAEVVWERSDE